MTGDGQLGTDAGPRRAGAGVGSAADAVRAAERQGDFLRAFDLADRALADDPGDLWLRHRAVLALARAGSTREAARRFERYRLDAVEDEDVAALQARIAKDLALATPEPGRNQALLAASRCYQAIYDRTGGYYPGINAASLAAIAGDRATARRLAARVLESLTEPQRDSYFGAATEAEAAVILRRPARARQALARAALLVGDDRAALATTRRQIRLVCAAVGVPGDVLEVIAAAAVVHYCGHRIAPDGTDDASAGTAERRAAAAIAGAVSAIGPGTAYGALASGGDILWAEALLASGAELHVVLPFAEDDFLASSVADAGPGWTDRFHQCLARAASVRLATDAAYLGDDVLFSYGSQVAMGLAVLHARYLDAPARQLALWDGRPARGEAGTAVDVATWKARGLPATIIETSRVAVAAPAHRRSPVALAPDRRVLRALLFGDFQGFSRLDDAEIRRFVAHVLEPLAAVLDRYGEAIEQRNSWGDALYIVLRDAASAAACALDLQDATAAIDLAAVGLPPHLALRLGAHIGPVIPVHDPITGQASFMGSHVTRTARIEPVTPPGAVYATEPFAAALILGDDAFTADYAGNIPAAKDHGALRMYRLLRASA